MIGGLVRDGRGVMTATVLPDYDAVVLTGGKARRMNGADKPALRVGRRPLVLRVAAAVPHASRVIVVGPTYPGLAADVVTTEDPPGGGPAAAVAEGVRHVRAPRVAVLAADLPFLTADLVDRLRADVEGHDLALLVDDSGRDQLLVAVWRTDALRATLGRVGAVSSTPLGRVVAAARDVVRRAVPATDRPPWFDCDTEADLALARRLAGRHRP